MVSTLIPAVVVVVTMWGANELAGTYGIALAAVGMLSTLGITLATDAYGPVADNAGGIAEQARDWIPSVRERTDALDSLGNTTAATGKGFAIGSAVLTALALMAAYSVATEVEVFNLKDLNVLMGLLVGALMPFLFGALTMQAVARAAAAMVQEVRRQFREIPGLLEGTAPADYTRAVDISTRGAMKEMVLPGVLAIVAPVAVGAILGAEALGGLLIGSIASGFLLAIMMANAGGAWGQRQEVHRGRSARRQGIERARRGRRRGHGRRPVQGHVRAGPQHPDQAHEHGRPGVRAAVPLAGKTASAAVESSLRAQVAEW